MTDKASNWYVKGMDMKKAYDNVMLLVACVADTEILTSQGQHVAVMQMEVPQGVIERYKVLVSDEGQELCHQKASENCSSLMIRAWQSALQTERLEWQTDEVRRRAKECGGWDAAYFVTVARCFGMGVNGDLMEQCKAERNEITKYWEQLGLRSMTAGDSQSLIQLQREYCNKHQCLRCRFGYEFLKK